jgi:nitroreductase
MSIDNPVLATIRSRKHAGALLLDRPGPTEAEMAAVLEAAAAAPDHGKLVPFRFVVVPDEHRAAYVEASLAAFRVAVPDADDVGLRKARGKAEQPPAVVALVARIDAGHAKIVASDQWLTVGSALQNLWLAAESLGFACGVSSGRLMDTAEMRRAFGVAEGEALVSIVSIGTPKERMPPRAKPALETLVSRFGG